jgi:hypothetical protein
VDAGSPADVEAGSAAAASVVALCVVDAAAVPFEGGALVVTVGSVAASV